MATIAQENFNSYTNGNSLNGASGGSGWSTNWTATDVTIQAPLAGNTNKVAYLSTISSVLSRDFNAPASNKITADFYVYKGSTATMMYFGMYINSNNYNFVFDGTNGQWGEYRYNGTTVTGQTTPFPNINTWYRATISIDKTTSTNNVVFSVNGIATATYSTTISSFGSTISFFQAFSSYGTPPAYITQINISDVFIPLTNNLVSYYKLDESSGNASDSVGSNTLTNSATTYATGKINNGAVFNGSAYLYKATTGLGSQAYFSQSLWVKFTSTARGDIFNMGGASAQPTIQLVANLFWNGSSLVNTAGYILANFYYGGSSHFVQSSAHTYNDGNWHHIVCILNGANTYLYIDGSLSNSDTNGSAIDVANISIGYDYANSGNGFTGSIDEAGIWTRALTADEISQLYNSNRALAYPLTAPTLYGGVAYYKLDESSGNASDSIGSNTGVNTSTTYATGKINNGAVFNGGTSKLALSPLGISGSQARSVSHWIYPTFFASQDITICTGPFITNGDSFSVVVQYGSSTTGSLAIDFSGIRYSMSPNTININTWYHIVAIYDGGLLSTSTVHLYLNGVAQTLTLTSGSPITPNTVDNTNTIGQSVPSVLYFSGTIDEVGFFNRALNSSEVTTLYNSGTGLQYPWFTDSTAQVLVVAGAGGGGDGITGYIAGSSGGAGGVTYTNVNFANGSYAITVGNGGSRVSYSTDSGTVFGGNSSIGSLIVTTGGGNGDGGNNGHGYVGPSYGGASNQNGGGGSGLAYGGHGGLGNFTGVNRIGLTCSISGSNVDYGFGGPVSTSDVNGANGTANTGNGGQGGGVTNKLGGNGASGIVIISYYTGSMTCTGGTITTSGSQTIHTFTSSGTFVVNGSATINSRFFNFM